MSEYGSEWNDNDGEYGQDHNAKDTNLEKAPELSDDIDQDYEPFKCPNYDKGDPEYDPFTSPDLTLKDDDSKEYDPFTPPDLTLKDDDSKEYDPFTPPDLTLKGESSNKEIEEEDNIKENESEFIEERSIDHKITFDHIFEKDLEDIAKDIDQSEELHAIYAEDVMIPSGEKEAVEQYYMEQMKAEGVIITNDLYFEEITEKKQVILDNFNEPTTNSINREKEQLNTELDTATKANFTEIDGKEISLANDITYENENHKLIEDGRKLNEHHEEIQIQEEKNLDATKSEVKDIDREQEIPHKYSSGQHARQILQQDVETPTNQESQEIKEENLDDTEEIRQNEVKEDLTSEIKNEVDKKEILQEKEKNQIKSSHEKPANEITREKSGFNQKTIDLEAEIKDIKREGIDKEIDFKEEWEKTLLGWIKELKNEDLSPEKKLELIEFMRKYRNAREEHTRLHYLHLKHKKNEISEGEKQERKYLREKIKEYDEIDEEIFKEFHAFRCFYDYNKKRWYDKVINSKKKRYPKLVAQKLQRLKDKKIKKTMFFQKQNLEELTKETNDERYELLKKRYHQETGGNAIYGNKETKGFKRWKKSLNEMQEDANKEFRENNYVIKEEWAVVLKNHIHDIYCEEISQEIKEEMKYVIDNYDILHKESKNLPPNLRQVVEELKQFQATYDVYKERGYDKSIPREVGRATKKLRKRIELIINEAVLNAVFNEENTIIQNIMENIRENIYLSIELNMNEKSKIIKIFQKENLKDEEKKEFVSILSNLSSKELKSLLGKEYNEHLLNVLNSNDFTTSFVSGYIHKSSNPEEKIEIKVPHFKQKLIEQLKKIHRLINGNRDQKEFIWIKALEILNEYISRAKNNEFCIPKDANLKVIASTIIYTVIISNKNMPKISGGQLAKIVNIRSPNYITKYYKKHFENIYQRKEFRFASYDFRKIRQILSTFFFKSIKNKGIETSELVLLLKENIENSINLPKQLTQKDINILREMVTQYQDIFIKYFSDLAEIIKQLIISSSVHKQIGAHIVIKHLADFLEEKGVNLFQTSEVFYRSIKEIYNSLKEIFPNYLPSRVRTQEKESDYEYRKIIGYKLKLFVIKHIYKGRYLKKGNIRCSECLKEGFLINTDISRLEALEFHHIGDEKEKKFTADGLYEYFVKNQSNPNVLKDLIKLMESEEVILVCRNHHFILHDDYYHQFKYLINWDNIFSLSSELMHIIIMTAVNNFYKTKDLPLKNKQYIRGKIVRKLKKRYIIELLYGIYCPTCGEINTRKHLPAFIYNHIDEELKTINASDLFTQMLPCSEIARILKNEKGGYICPNCHTVFHYKNLNLLNKIYEDNNLVNKILDDYNRVLKKFKLIQDVNLIKDPFKKSVIITENIERYLTAIYEISNSGLEVTNRTLRETLGVSRQTISDFFKKNDFIKKLIDIDAGKAHTPTKYILNSRGRKVVSLIFHFRDYYMNKI